MESNLFVKSYKTQGNKITDIEFYGDWEIDVGGGSPVEVEYDYIGAMTNPTLPYGITWKKEKESDRRVHFTFSNASDKSYIMRISDLQSFLLEPDTEINVNTNVASLVTNMTIYFFSQDLKVLSGYLVDNA